VIKRLPADKELVVYVAVEPCNADVPRIAPPFLNVTVPVGAGSPKFVLLAVTVAVNVTASPRNDGFNVDATAVEVGTLVTTWLRTADVLPRLLLSPE
jgi:hypothetical protein